MDKHLQLKSVNPLATNQLSRKVRFFRTCNVILIPCNQDYKNASIDLWFTKNDLNQLQEDAKMEIKEFMHKNTDITTVQEAITALYQPSPTSITKAHDIESLDAPRLVRGVTVFK